VLPGTDIEVKKPNGSSSMSTMIENMGRESTRIREATRSKLPDKRPKVRHTAVYCAQRSPRRSVVEKCVSGVPWNVTDGHQVWANCAVQDKSRHQSRHFRLSCIWQVTITDSFWKWTVTGDEKKG